ncbi:MAG: lysine--tRNA ligase [Actinomycetota bacterium]|nr:lysine--tRNA ligase [Actinomycetota bacterium]
MKVRRHKRERMLATGTDPYPVEVPRTRTLREIRDAYVGLPPDTVTGEQVAVTGRVIFLRNTGKLCFATLREGDGTELQAMLSLAGVGAERLAAWKADVDLGDHVSVVGEVVTSRRGELSVQAREWQMAAKALRPLPIAHKDLAEETRVRHRYLDLIVRDAARRTARVRTDVVRSVREMLHSLDFIEVETPMLQMLHGGAAARPFVTHSNALDIDLYLRIAPELYLKRCVVGGMERVFELNRVFRNEGADSTHSPEFTMLEVYQAYTDYNGMAQLTRSLYQTAARDVFGSTTLRLADGSEYDIGGEWAQISLFDAVSKALGEQISPATRRTDLVRHAEQVGLAVHPGWLPGKLVEELFEHLVVPDLHVPTFVRDFPVDTSPLTREHRSTAGLVEKWDLYIRSVESATAYSELVDPIVQRERFQMQAALTAAGDDEAMPLDEDFLDAMEYGMPPSGGMGMGIDRLLMALTGSGIRETILFPLVRPQ